MTSEIPLHALARVLILVGGVVLIVGAVSGLVNVGGILDLVPSVRTLGSLSGALVGLFVGVLALVGSARVKSAAWDLILLVLGLFVGSLGGILVFIGALIALVATFVKI